MRCVPVAWASPNGRTRCGTPPDLCCRNCSVRLPAATVPQPRTDHLCLMPLQGFSGPSPSSTLRRPGDGPGADPARRALVHHHRTWSAADPDSSPFRHADTHQLALLSRLVMPALRLRVRGGPCGMRRAAHIETRARAPRGHK